MMQPYEPEELSLWPFGEWTRGLFPSVRGAVSSSELSVWEEKDDVIVEAPLPGIKPQEVDLNFEKGTLTIRASRKEEKEDKEKKFFHKSSSSFVYRLSIPGEIDDSIEPEATLNEGMLQVRFKKQQHSLPKKNQRQTEIIVAAPLPSFDRRGANLETHKTISKSIRESTFADLWTFFLELETGLFPTQNALKIHFEIISIKSYPSLNLQILSIHS